jgi:hypothetical protein
VIYLVDGHDAWLLLGAARAAAAAVTAGRLRFIASTLAGLLTLMWLICFALLRAALVASFPAEPGPGLLRLTAAVCVFTLIFFGFIFTGLRLVSSIRGRGSTRAKATRDLEVSEQLVKGGKGRISAVFRVEVGVGDLVACRRLLRIGRDER